MPIDTSRARSLLKQLDLQHLFVEELGWANPSRKPLSLEADGRRFTLSPVAEQGGLVVFEVAGKSDEGIPDRATRVALHTRLLQHAQEHILVFTNRPRTASLWLWVEREGGKRKAIYEHRFHTQQPGDSLLQKLEGLAFAWDELDADGKASIVQVTDKVRQSLATERVTKRFYDEFQKQHAGFLKFIQGIDGIRDREWYASIMLNRLMFIYFIQKKGFLGGDTGYLRTRLADCQMQRIPFYDGFLKTLFFKGFACKPEERTPDEQALLGPVPYLNGGLFLKHQIEEANAGVDIPDQAFEAVFAFFDRYQWHLDDRPLRGDNEINPDVLGYIFEKYINQKQMGAYYTREDITEYICRNTVLPFLFDKLRHFRREAVEPLPLRDVDPYLFPAMLKGVDLDLPPDIAAGLDVVAQRTGWNRAADEDFALPTETWREHIARRKRVQQIRQEFAAGRISTINDFITYNLDIIKFAQDFIADTDDPLIVRAFYFECLKTVTVLDPTCGSGAFLFAALNILEPLYELCLQRMEEFLARKQRHPQWAQPFEQELENLARHPSRRYFIYKTIVVSNLFGVDIMEEAVEICKLRLFLKLVAQVEDVAQVEPLPDIDFNIRAGNTLVGYASLEEIERAKTQTMDFSGGNIKQRALALSALLDEFRQGQLRTDSSAQLIGDAKRAIREQQQALEGELNEDLRAQYGALNLEGFVASHRPFHWFVEFTTIMVSGGFDVIVGNPPYVEYSKVRDEYTVRGYASESCNNLWAYVTERSLRLLGGRGTCGLILPMSLVCTDRMAPVQKLLSGAGLTWLSNYESDSNPGQLFDGVKQNVTILLHQAGRPSYQFTTRLLRFFAEARDFVFYEVEYVPAAPPYIGYGFPKCSTPVEAAILQRMFAHPPLAGTMDPGGTPVLVHRIAHYYIKCFDFVPYFRSDRDGVKRSEDYKEYTFGGEVGPVVAAVNSSLFYLYWQALYDAFKAGKLCVETFPGGDLPASEVSGELGELASRLMDDMQERSKRLRAHYAATGDVEYDQFYPRHSKPIIDEIDRVLAEHYGFTDEELDFIINYDIKYRMGGAETGADEDTD